MTCSCSCPFQPQCPIPGVSLTLFHLGGSPDDFSRWRNTLNPIENARAERFVFEADRLRFIAGRGQLREHLGHHLSLPPERVGLEVEAHGKPCLPAAPELLFNLSHTGDHALLAVRWRQSEIELLGVDIETERPLDDLAALARIAFSDRERAYVLSLEDPQRHGAFFEVWSKKEAVIKALGDGVGYGLKRFVVPVGPLTLHFDNTIERPGAWEVTPIEVGPSLRAAVALRLQR